MNIIRKVEVKPMSSIRPSITAPIPIWLIELIIGFGKIVPIREITAQLFRNEVKVNSPALRMVKIALLLSVSGLNAFKAAVMRIRVYPTSPPDRVLWSSRLLELSGRLPKSCLLDAHTPWHLP